MKYKTKLLTTSHLSLFLVFLAAISLFFGCGIYQIKIGQNVYTYNENKPCAKNYHNEEKAYIAWVKYENLSYDSAYNFALQSITELSLNNVVSPGQVIFTDKATGTILLTRKFIFGNKTSDYPDIIYSTTTIIVKKDGIGSIIEIKNRGGDGIPIPSSGKENTCIFFEIMDRRLNKA